MVESLEAVGRTMLAVPGAITYTWIIARVISSRRISRKLRRILAVAAAIGITLLLSSFGDVPRPVMLAVVGATFLLVLTGRADRLLRRALRAVLGGV